MTNKKFFKNYLLIILSTIFLLISLIFFSEKQGFGYKYDKLLDYQISKFDNFDKETEVVFLGDSSMGYVLDSKVWGKKSKKKTINLALIGDYQFSGVLAFFEMLPKKNIKEIYIMANIDSWRIKTSDNYYKSLKNRKSIFNNFFKINEDLNLYNFVNILRFYFFDSFKRKKVSISKNNDYIDQGNIINDDYLDRVKPFQKDQIIKSKIEDLKKIFLECNNLNIKCLYVHGPILDIFCKDKNVLEFQNEINLILKKNKIPYLSNNICINFDHIGDGFGHVAPKNKSNYTLKYFNYINNNER